MEQFKGYSEAIRYNEIDCSDYNVRCTGLSCKDCQTIRKATWKAALEWFRKRIYNFDHAWATQGVINEELEE